MAKAARSEAGTSPAGTGPEDLGFLLRQAAGAQRLRLERSLLSLDVTPAQYVILSQLARFPGISNADLARVTALTPQTVNLIVQRLSRRGLVGRLHHTSHGRILHLVISDTGRVLLRSCDERARALEEEMLEGLKAEQRQFLRDWLVATAQPPGEAG